MDPSLDDDNCSAGGIILNWWVVHFEMGTNHLEISTLTIPQNSGTWPSIAVGNSIPTGPGQL